MTLPASTFDMDCRDLGPDGAYATRRLAPPDLADLQRLFERAADYFEVATGAPPAKDEAQRAFIAGPPDKSVDDKRVIGVFDRDGALHGVLDALIDWPVAHTWTVGMLLLAPEHRGRGVGTAVTEAFERWAAMQGATDVRTALVTHHARGIAFVARRGYRPESRVDGYDAGTRTVTIQFFTKSLAG